MKQYNARGMRPEVIVEDVEAFPLLVVEGLLKIPDSLKHVINEAPDMGRLFRTLGNFMASPANQAVTAFVLMRCREVSGAKSLNGGDNATESSLSAESQGVVNRHISSLTAMNNTINVLLDTSTSSSSSSSSSEDKNREREEAVKKLIPRLLENAEELENMRVECANRLDTLLKPVSQSDRVFLSEINMTALQNMRQSLQPTTQTKLAPKHFALLVADIHYLLNQWYPLFEQHCAAVREVMQNVDSIQRLRIIRGAKIYLDNVNEEEFSSEPEKSFGATDEYTSLSLSGTTVEERHAELRRYFARHVLRGRTQPDGFCYHLWTFVAPLPNPNATFKDPKVQFKLNDINLVLTGSIP